MAWRTVCHNRRQTIAVFFLSACAMVLLLTASFLGIGLRGGLIAAVEPFDLLVGSGGSYQMVINTVFLQDYPAGNVHYELVEKLRADPKVAAAIPLAFGDNYRGYRLVGTERCLFEQADVSGTGKTWLCLDRGELFTESRREAVVGARAARELGLQLGDEIVSSHGLIETKNSWHNDSYRICGILQSCNGPYDRAIFVPLRSIWEAHNHERDKEWDEEGVRGKTTEELIRVSRIGNDNGDDEGHGFQREATAIMVRPSGYAEAYQLFNDFQREKYAEMVFPSQVVIRLLSILGQAEWVFKAVGAAAGLLAAVIVALVLYWSVCARRKEIRILGLLGAEKSERLFIIALEGMFVVFPGICFGFLTGHLLLSIFCGILSERTGLAAAVGISPFDAGLAGVLVAAGLLGGLSGGRQSMRDGE